MGLTQINLAFNNIFGIYSREFLLVSFYSFGPLFFLFTKRTLSVKPSRYEKIITTLPLIHLFIWYFFIKEHYDANSYFTDLNDFPSSLYNLLFGLYSLITVRKHMSVHNHINNWLLLVNGSFVLIIASYIASETFSYFQFNTMASASIIICYCLVMIFIYIQVFLALRYPDLFLSNKYLRDRIGEYKEDKYKSSPLDHSYSNHVIVELERFVKENLEFQNSELSLNDVSQKIGFPSRDISQVINTILNQSFKEYINDFRIKYAAELLKKEPTLRIQEVMFHSGFNSKSIFNKYFKMKFKMTPKEYRKGFY